MLSLQDACPQPIFYETTTTTTLAKGSRVDNESDQQTN
jgi:hypothetical protein